MSLGSSEPWPMALERLTDLNELEMSPQALLTYFRPLHHWLQTYNQEHRNPTLH